MKNFYLDINSILDARAGVINRLNPEKYAEIVRSGYHLRKGDFFSGINPEEFRAMYNANEIETLLESTMTNVFQFLYPQVVDVMKEFIASEADTRERPVLEVNVFPYDYTEEEMTYLRGVVYLKMQGVIGVEVYNRDIKELDPVYCASRYAMMVSYDYDRYINTHSDALIKSPQPHLILVAPMVYFNTDPETNDETIDQLREGINSLSVLEAHIASRICLRFVNVDIFSIVYPDNRVLEQNKLDLSNQRSIEELERVLLKDRDKNKRIPEV